MIDNIKNIRELLEKRLSEYPEKTWLICGDEQVTFRQLNERTNRIANGLKECGVGKGDFVALLVKNCPEFIYLWFAILKLGAVMVPVNLRLMPREVSYILNHARPKSVFVGEQSMDLISDIKDDLGTGTNLVYLGHEQRDGFGHISDYDNMSPELDPVKISPEDDAVCLYTSGTTGNPKGVILAHKTYLMTGASFAEATALKPDDRLLTANPLFHVNAQCYSTFGTLVSGATLILMEHFSASRMWGWIRQYRANKVVMLLAIASILFSRGPEPDDADNPAELIVAGGAPKGRYRDFEKRFGTKLQTLYSLTESPMGVMCPIEETAKDGGIGRPMPSPEKDFRNSVIIADEKGRCVPKGKTGEVLIKNPALMKGYLKDPEATARVLEDGWLHTGDRGMEDEDGYLFFLGRVKDMIRKKGENISAPEVEGVINSHPDVVESAVIGIMTDDTLGEEEIKAFIVIKGKEYDLSGLIEHCSERLADFKIPRYWEVIEELPKNAMNRVMKKRLSKDLYTAYDRVIKEE